MIHVNPFDTGFDENSNVMKFSAVARDVVTITHTFHPPPRVLGTVKRSDIFPATPSKSNIPTASGRSTPVGSRSTATAAATSGIPRSSTKVASALAVAAPTVSITPAVEAIEEIKALPVKEDEDDLVVIEGK